MRVRDAAPIDDYLRTLGAALRGPSRLKAELLAEARGSLEDAADAYARSGLDPRAAQHRAVADFGTAGELAPGYQAELTAGQGRRLALVVALLPAAMLTAHLMWWQPPGDPATPPSLFLFIVRALDATAYLAGGLALLGLVLLGPAGRRRAVDPRAIVRPLAVVALAASAGIWLVGTFAAVTAVLESPRALTWPPMIAAWVLLNTVFGLLARYAVRTITVAGRRGRAAGPAMVRPVPAEVRPRRGTGQSSN